MLTIARKSITEETKDKVIELLEAGLSTRKAAKEAGISDFSVSKIAKERGFHFDTKANEMAAKCKTKYAQAARIDVVSEGINKLREMLHEINRAKDMRDWAVSLGILIDKRRLEDSEADNGKGGEIHALITAMEANNGVTDPDRQTK